MAATKEDMIRLAKEAGDEIRRITDDNYTGMKNEAATQQIKLIFSRLRHAIPNAYVGEKITEGEWYLEMAYSSRKYEKFPGGLDAVTSQLRHVADNVVQALQMHVPFDDKRQIQG
jgi:hypothetical protein